MHKHCGSINEASLIPFNVKAKLRSEKLLERLNHHPTEKKKKDEQILQKLLMLPEFQHARTVLLYLPIHGEVDLRELFARKNHKLNKKFILPRVKDEKTLHLYHVSNLDEVEVGRYKIMEPKTHLKQANPEEIDLAIVPGIVFAENGHRIGYGKGFYDRLLKKINTPKIGVAYHFQIVENIPGEVHDTPMDMIITEQKTIQL